MNTPKVKKESDKKNHFPAFSAMLREVMPRQNGTPAGVSALAESLKRGNAYVEAQQRINDLCNPVQSQLANTLTQEA